MVTKKKEMIEKASYIMGNRGKWTAWMNRAGIGLGLGSVTVRDRKRVRRRVIVMVRMMKSHDRPMLTLYHPIKP